MRSTKKRRRGEGAGGMSLDKNDDIDSFSTASGDGTKLDVVVDVDAANATKGGCLVPPTSSSSSSSSSSSRRITHLVRASRPPPSPPSPPPPLLSPSPPPPSTLPPSSPTWRVVNL
ncbi:hypothetical protein HZH66_003343 [Vespula vulgaris]|uniref:Uncharacterized protein n=1 Tax=Vespula vulgaris TaxID=7454 RepID=A0A834KN43_VESVU|nr:hypothetical protein HZH66_003343 [Vespula vulgaris]